MIKRIVAALAAIVMVIMISGCSTVSTEPDEVALHYSGGSFSSKNFKECVAPSDRQFNGPGDEHYVYPANQRTFSFTGTSSEAEMDPVPVVTSDGQTLRVPGFVKFTLTSECNSLYDFHEKVGVKYDAYTSDGWRTLLNDYLGVAVTSALNDAAGDAGWQPLYRDSKIRADIESELNTVLQGRVNSSLGGDWLKINSVTLSKPLASEELVDGLEAAEKAKLDNKAQEQRNAVARTKYDSMTDCRKSGLSEQSCLTIYLAESGDIPFYPVPQGGNLNIAPK